jgi:hypothetical protein
VNGWDKMPLGEHIGKQIYVSFKTTGSKWGGGMSLIGTLVGIERDIQLIEINDIVYIDTTLDTNIIFKG